MLNESAGVYAYKGKDRIAASVSMFFDKKIYFFKYGKDTTFQQTLNLQRRKYGLCAIAEAEKKVVYQYHKKSGYFKFFKTTGIVGSIGGLTQEMVDKTFRATGLQITSF